MINFRTHLHESRSAPLYHGTNLGAAEQILQANRFSANTMQSAKLLGGRASKYDHKWDSKGVVDIFTQGVSLSRNPKTAIRFGNIVFVLNQQKLATRHRIVPLQYYHDSKTNMRKMVSNEFEEYVIGPIENAADYILKILVPPGMVEYSTSPLMKFPRIETYSPTRVQKGISR